MPPLACSAPPLQSVQHFCSAVPDTQTFLWHFGQTAHLQPSVLRLLPSQQTVLIVPSCHFPANYSLHLFPHSVSPPLLASYSFPMCRYLSLLVTVVATAGFMWPLPGFFFCFLKRDCRFLACTNNLKEVKPGSCWNERRMNSSPLEGTASLHKAFAALDDKRKSIPIKSINSLLSGNNKDFYSRINQAAGCIAIRWTPICPPNENAQLNYSSCSHTRVQSKCVTFSKKQPRLELCH